MSVKGGAFVVSFEPLKRYMSKKGLSFYRLKTEKVIGSATFDNIRLGSKSVTTDTINAICRYLDCQPGDIMEYVPDSLVDKTGE